MYGASEKANKILWPENWRHESSAHIYNFLRKSEDICSKYFHIKNESHIPV